ncbi:hypothetical protein [Desulfonatronovibrio hydrogenovorans]|uniref:hypothetical protein n=1 Tax=Desulfonatronovibrio hydrogenovorans TaxID=53245 RepID=UPI00048C0C4B|nr:hypothetical protein [Desulfonatronovibrio hydrogenovorans]
MSNHPPDKLTQLLEVTDQADQTELKILYNAQIKCAKAYNTESTLARKKDWDAARAGLQEAVDRMWIKYAGADDEVIPRNRLEAVAHLKRQGWKIGKTKFYQDCNKGLVKIQSDGSILPRDLDVYAVRAGLDRFAAPETQQHVDEVGELHEVKLKKEIEKLNWENKKREFEYQKELGKYVPRELLELELASRAAVLDSQLRTRIRSRAREWTALVQGKHELVPELITAALAMLDQAMNEFARMDRFQVIFGDENEGNIE